MRFIFIFYLSFRRDVYGLVRRIKSRRYIISYVFHESVSDRSIYDVRLGDAVGGVDVSSIKEWASGKVSVIEGGVEKIESEE